MLCSNLINRIFKQIAYKCQNMQNAVALSVFDKCSITEVRAMFKFQLNIKANS